MEDYLKPESWQHNLKPELIRNEEQIWEWISKNF
jgi:hypothetical protein